MSTESKTAKAAREAVARGSQVKETRTPAQIEEAAIKNLRGLRAAGGHVSPTDVDQLLFAYDRLLSFAEVAETVNKKHIEDINALRVENSELKGKIEEFRSVYESENRSTSLTVEREPIQMVQEFLKPKLANDLASEPLSDGTYITEAAAAQVSET